jgi:hypothetical protein
VAADVVELGGSRETRAAGVGPNEVDDDEVDGVGDGNVIIIITGVGSHHHTRRTPDSSNRRIKLSAPRHLSQPLRH